MAGITDECITEDTTQMKETTSVGIQFNYMMISIGKRVF